MGFVFHTYNTRVSIGLFSGFYKQSWLDVYILGWYLIDINSGVDRQRWKIGPWHGAHWRLQ
jgi:hypothetical protein